MWLLIIEILPQKIMAKHFKLTKCIIAIVTLVKLSFFGMVCSSPRWSLNGQKYKIFCGMSRLLDSRQ